MLSSHQKAPDFSGTNQDGRQVNLSQFLGKQNVVLYFYPKDDTPGCTIEANQFTGLAPAFSALDTLVIGVSKDTCESHLAFIDKYALKLDLLSDASGEICKLYDTWQEKERNGEKKMGIVRATFVIDKKGMLALAQYGVTAEGHAESILEFVKNMEK